MSLKKFGTRFRPGLGLKWSEWKHETLQRSNILKLLKQIWEQIVSQKVRSTFLLSPSGCECGIYHCDSRDTGWEVGTLCHLRKLTASEMTSVFAKLAHSLQKVLILYPEDNTGHLRWQQAATQTETLLTGWLWMDVQELRQIDLEACNFLPSAVKELKQHRIQYFYHSCHCSCWRSEFSKTFQVMGCCHNSNSEQMRHRKIYAKTELVIWSSLLQALVFKLKHQ